MGTGSRYNATIEDTQIELTFQFTKNYEEIEPSSFDKVEIYGSETDMENRENIVETITSISSDGNGLATVNVDGSLLTEEKVYYDLWYITPVSDAVQQTFSLAFFVAAVNYGGSPQKQVSVCNVSGYLYDSNGNALQGASVMFKLKQSGIPTDNTKQFITDIPVYTNTDSLGFFHIAVVRSTEFSTSIKYEMDIRKGGFRETYEVTIPDDLGINFNELSMERVG